MIFRLPRRRNRKLSKRPRRRTCSLPSLELLEDRVLLAAAPVGDELQVNFASLGPQSTSVESAVVAINDTGNTVVAYGGRGPGDRSGIFVRRIDEDGQPMGDVARVNGTTRGVQESPTLGISEDGGYVIVWSGRGPADRHGIFAQRFDASGSPLGTEVLVNSTPGGAQRNPVLAMASDGRYVVAWSGNGPGDFDGIFLQSFDADGNRVGGETRVNTTTADQQAFPATAMSDTGQIVVTWSSRHQDGSDWGVFGQRFDAAGTPEGDEFPVNDTTAASQFHPSVAFEDRGGFSVVWSSFGQDGDSWGVFGRQFEADATPVGEEFAVNSTTEGHQRDAQVTAAGGQLLVTWNSGLPNGKGWEAVARSFNAEATADGEEFFLTADFARAGHQRFPFAALNNDGNATVVYSSDSNSVFALRLHDEEVQGNRAPELDPISDQIALPDNQLEVTITATDFGDTLTFQIDADNSPDSAELEQIDNITAIIRWTPSAEDGFGLFDFRVLVTDDDDEIPLSDSEDFTVEVTSQPVVDLNGDASAGIDFAAAFTEDGGPVAIVDIDLTVTDEDDDELVSATASLANLLDGAEEVLSVDTDGTITASYDPQMGVLELTGDAGLAQYAQVLQTLTYNNTSQDPNTASRVVEVEVHDGKFSSVDATSTVTIVAQNGAPVLASVSDQQAPIDVPLEVTVTASDSDSADTLNYALADAPASATIEKQDNNTALIRWTPTATDGNGPFTFRVVVTDDGGPSLNDEDEFTVTVTRPPVVDLNGDDQGGIDFSATFTDGGGPVLIVDPLLRVTDPNDIDLFSALVRLTNPLDGEDETLEVDTLGTDITDSYDSLTGQLTLDGEDSVGNYERVLRTLTYENVSPSPTVVERVIEVTASDEDAQSEAATVTVNIETQNLPPEAIGEAFQVDRGSAVNVFALLTNDIDPDVGDTVSFESVGPGSAGGDVIISANGTVEYTPDSDFLGVERFDYTIRDERGVTDVATVTVQVTRGDSPLELHIHANMTVFVNGESVEHPPADIGVADQGIISKVHTHDADGRIHIHSIAGIDEITEPVMLGEFFDAWRTKGGIPGNNPDSIFNENQIYDNVVDQSHQIRMTVNGVPNSEFENYVIQDEDVIAISYETITDPDAPSFVPIEELTVLAGSPLHIPLDGFDLNSQTLDFSAVSDNGLLSASILQNNRSMRINVRDYGQMVIELYENRAPRVTDAIIALANDEVYDGVIFHRVINGFVIQGGDPTGTGSGDPTLPRFDDQFHVDLQHNHTGVLSMAKAGDDSNSSQFFIIEGSTRSLDFNHSVFGQVVEGENIRELISNAPLQGQSPDPAIVMDSVGIFQDNENAILMLKAPEGTSGDANVTVTVTDQDGNEYEQTFHVTVQPDTSNGGPFLDDPPTITTSVDTPVQLEFFAIDAEGDPIDFDFNPVIPDAATSVVPNQPFQIRAQDVEGDAVRFNVVGDGTFDFDVDRTSGIVTVRPMDSNVQIEIRVGPAPGSPSNTGDRDDRQTFTINVV